MVEVVPTVMRCYSCTNLSVALLSTNNGNYEIAAEIRSYY